MIPGELSPTFKLRILCKTVLIIISSIIIAVIPQVTSFEDYFMNGLYYPNTPLFVGAPDKAKHIKTIVEYYGSVSTTNIPWVMIRVLVAEMFTHDNNGVTGKSMGFYSNDGVCLFKYFVQDDDPQKVFSLTVLAVNSICFLIITTCYITVNIMATRSSKACSTKNSNTRRLQQKITIIVITDFACWIPFILTCLLHFAEVFDATDFYGFFSIVVLPLNSVLNPLIYDGVIGNLVSRGLSGKSLRSLRIRSRIQNPNYPETLCSTTEQPGVTVIEKPCLFERVERRNYADTAIDNK